MNSTTLKNTAGEPAEETLRKGEVAASPENKSGDTHRSVGMYTLGCRLNQFESDGILSRFESNGYVVKNLEEGPDIVIINTCTVTDQADARNRNIIRKAIKKNPTASVVVTGCFAQTDPQKIQEIPGVALVVGNDKKSSLFEIIEENLSRPDESTEDSTGKRKEAEPLAVPPVISSGELDFIPDRKTSRPVLPVMENPFAYGDAIPQGHTRAYMKIQDGCDRRCTYCKIPRARGRGVSRPMADILEHVRGLEERGVPEIVITGVNLGWYRDLDLRFNDLLEKILDNLETARLRVSSIEPCDVDAQFGELTLHPRMCDFLHIPLQSGSRDILRKMKRTYNPYSFRKRVEAVKSVNPDIFVGTDVIVGFPGEKEQHFLETTALLQDLEIANIHAFRFSPREGTPAADMAERPAHALVKERMLKLQELKEKYYFAYAKKFLGQTREGVIEKSGDRGEALTDNFLRLSWSDNTEGASQKETNDSKLALFEIREIDGEGKIQARRL